MDIILLNTFLEVARTGSFGTAADKLYVTQSAVSLRIQKLETQLGRSLFERSKAGAELTNAGEEFSKYARSLLKLWEDARQRISIPDGFKHSLAIGAEYSLWPRLGFRWLDRIQERVPDLAIRGEVGMPDRLTRFLTEGVLQCALTYTPYLRPGLEANQILNEDLVLVTTWPKPTLEMTKGRYVYIDWGPDFSQFHATELAVLENTGLTLSIGSLGLDYVLNRQAAAYLPARHVKPHIDAGTLHLVTDAPRFPYPIWAVWRSDTDPIVRAAGQTCLEDITQDIEIKTNQLFLQSNSKK